MMRRHGEAGTAYDALGLPSHLAWGTSTGFGQSSFDIGGTNGNFLGFLTTNAAPINTVVIVHDNNAITGDSLTSATLTDNLTLTATSPGGPALPLGLLFGINFAETPNSTPCAAASPGGNPCNDIFSLDASGNGVSFQNSGGTPFLAQDFMYEGELYGINLFMNGLSFLPNGVCAAASAANGCVGFTTIENQANTFQVSLQIVHNPIRELPEPLTMSLFGVGLAGAAIARRRMKKSA
ncbi:MAG: THxN family PEP-CTERM protein [Polaromonas sp.]